MLTLGVSWGVYLLFQLGKKQNFMGLNVLEVNAHGQAQIFGWIGMMMMGSIYWILPKLTQKQLPWPFLRLPVWGSVTLGMILSIIGLLGYQSVPFTFLGGVLTFIGVALFAFQISRHLVSIKDPAPAILFVKTALVFLVISTLYSSWHHFALVAANNREDLLWQVATFQAPLRDLQVHGLGLFMALGFMMWVIAPVDAKIAKKAWYWLFSGVVLEVGLFLSYRIFNQSIFAAFLLIPWLCLLIGSFQLLIYGKLYKELPLFAKGATLWLFLSLAMLLCLPIYSSIAHLSFSHAYYGAIRHAVTVGFLTQLIFGMSFIFLKRFLVTSFNSNGLCFIFLNIGCLARVGLQILSDFSPYGFSLIPLSGLLELTATVLWGWQVLKVLKKANFLGSTTHFLKEQL